MALQYPISFPTGIAPLSYRLGYVANVLVYTAPDSFITSTYEKPGKAWTLVMEFPPIASSKRNEMAAFMASLKGMYGSFKFYPKNPTAQAVTNTTISAHNTLRDNLTLASVATLAVGDYVRVGTQLLQILKISGSSIDIFPSLRADSVGATLTGTDVYGVFRLKSNEQSWSTDINWQAGFTLEAAEAI